MFITQRANTAILWTVKREVEILAKLSVSFAANHATLHQTVHLMTYKQYLVLFFHSKARYNSQKRCMIVSTVCFK